MAEQSTNTVTGSHWTDGILWLTALAAVCFLGAIGWKGCQGYNERRLEYAKNGYSEVARDVWVKLSQTSPPSPATSTPSPTPDASL